MEENTMVPTVKSVSVKWGVILSVISIAFFLTTSITGMNTQSWVSWLGYIPTIILMYLAHKEFKDQGDGYMSYGQGLKIGTFMVAISSVVSSAFAYAYIKFVDPTFMEMIKDQQVQDMVDQGMSDSEIEMAVEMSSGFMTPEIIMIFGFLASVFFGFILSLIISAITKNSNPEYEV